MNESAAAYKTSATLGKSPLDLILTVYDGTIKAYRDAETAFSANDLDKGHNCLEQAKKCVTHLYTTLDFEKGGDVAVNLGKLYVFLLNQTEIANATKDLKIIRDNIQLLTTVREGWVGIKPQASANSTETADHRALVVSA